MTDRKHQERPSPVLRPPWLRGVFEGERVDEAEDPSGVSIEPGTVAPAHPIYTAIAEALDFILSTVEWHDQYARLSTCGFLLYDARMMEDLCGTDPDSPFGHVWRWERLPSGAGVAWVERVVISNAIAGGACGGVGANDPDAIKADVMRNVDEALDGHTIVLLCRGVGSGRGSATVVQVPLPRPRPVQRTERKTGLRLVPG